MIFYVKILRSNPWDRNKFFCSRVDGLWDMIVGGSDVDGILEL